MKGCHVDESATGMELGKLYIEWWSIRTSQQLCRGTRDEEVGRKLKVGHVGKVAEVAMAIRLSPSTDSGRLTSCLQAAGFVVFYW